MISDLKRKFNSAEKENLVEIVKGMLSKNDILFIYLGGSYAYGFYDDSTSDVDVNVFISDYSSFMHLSIDHYDFFIYGENYIKSRNTMNHKLPLYNKIFIDDKLSLPSTLVYLNPKYQKEYDEYLNFNLVEVLHDFLTNFYDYFMFLYIDNETPTKRFYHVIRLRGQLENYLKTGKFTLNLPHEYFIEARKYKDNLDNEISKEIYVSKIGRYLEEINSIKEGL